MPKFLFVSPLRRLRREPGKKALLIMSAIGMDILFVFANWFNATAMSHLGTVFLEGGSCRSKLFISRVFIWSFIGSYPFASLKT